MSQPGERQQRRSDAHDLAWVVAIILSVVVACLLVRWAYTAWYIDTHCTMVLGTRVCN